MNIEILANKYNGKTVKTINGSIIKIIGYEKIDKNLIGLVVSENNVGWESSRFDTDDIVLSLPPIGSKCIYVSELDIDEQYRIERSNVEKLNDINITNDLDILLNNVKQSILNLHSIEMQINEMKNKYCN